VSSRVSSVFLYYLAFLFYGWGIELLFGTWSTCRLLGEIWSTLGHRPIDRRLVAEERPVHLARASVPDETIKAKRGFFGSTILAVWEQRAPPVGAVQLFAVSVAFRTTGPAL
jgi:hypothetical protein